MWLLGGGGLSEALVGGSYGEGELRICPLAGTPAAQLTGFSVWITQYAYAPALHMRCSSLSSQPMHVQCVRAMRTRLRQQPNPVPPPPPLQAAKNGRKLLHVVEAWLREEKRKRREAAASGAAAQQAAQQRRREPLMPSKHMAFFR